MTGHPRNLDLGKFKLRDVRGFARPFVGCFVARAVALGVVWRPNAAPGAKLVLPMTSQLALYASTHVHIWSF